MLGCLRSPLAGAALLGSVCATAAAGAGAAAAAAAVAGGALRGALPGLPWAELDSAAAGAQAQLPGITALAGSHPPVWVVGSYVYSKQRWQGTSCSRSSFCLPPAACRVTWLCRYMGPFIRGSGSLWAFCCGAGMFNFVVNLSCL